jgi:hypothetical protein
MCPGPCTPAHKRYTYICDITILFPVMRMPNITLSLPSDIHKMMQEYPEIRWSEVARRAIVEKLEALQRLDELTKDSKLTQKDVDELDHIIKKSLAARYRKIYGKKAK